MSGELPDPPPRQSQAAKREFVSTRAGGRCEYCRAAEVGQLATFEVEHVVPSGGGGSGEVENLAWACGRCNRSKSDRVELTDPQTGATVAVFDPRAMRWRDHFAWRGHELVGRTPLGRALVEALDLNSARRTAIRQDEQVLGRFPPPDDV